jgi:hypothetical protein
MSVLPDAISESLDYNNIKRRAVASRSYRVKLAPSNGSVFQPSQTINFDLPSNLAGTYVDFSQTYIRFNVSYVGTNASKGYLPKCGAYSLMQRVQCVTSGQSIFDLNNYNVLAACLMDTDSSQEWRGNAGNVLAGTMAAVPRGEYIDGSITRNYCLPFVLHPLAMQKKLVPLFSLDSLRFRIILETAANAFITTTANAAVGYIITEAEMVCYFTELSPSAQAQVNSMTGGVYQLLCPSYMNSQTTMTAATTAVTATLGVAVSSLERIIVVHRNTSAAVFSSDSIGARICNNIQTVQFFINSEAYPMRAMNFADAGAEILAEYLISDHALSDFEKPSMIQAQVNASYGITEAAFAAANVSASATTQSWIQPTTYGDAASNVGTGTSTIGSFLVSLELESGVSAGKSDRLYSGISTISSVVQYKGTYTASSVAATIDFFSHFTILLVLDMNRLGVWQMSQ